MHCATTFSKQASSGYLASTSKLTFSALAFGVARFRLTSQVRSSSLQSITSSQGTSFGLVAMSHSVASVVDTRSPYADPVATERSWRLVLTASAVSCRARPRSENVRREVARGATLAHSEPVTGAANRGSGREKSSKMTEVAGVDGPCEAEIVEPAGPAGPSGRLLTRGQVARRLGTSLSTVRRMEGEQLKPIIGPRGVHYFEETEIQAVFVRVRRARIPDNERADGT